jgi:hypothetical protein
VKALAPESENKGKANIARARALMTSTPKLVLVGDALRAFGRRFTDFIAAGEPDDSDDDEPLASSSDAQVSVASSSSAAGCPARPRTRPDRSLNTTGVRTWP